VIERGWLENTRTKWRFEGEHPGTKCRFWKSTCRFLAVKIIELDVAFSSKPYLTTQKVWGQYTPSGVAKLDSIHGENIVELSWKYFSMIYR
jgi:hypothetical protein